MTAPSSIRPDDRAEARGPGAVESLPNGVRPDDRAGVRGPGAVPTIFAQPSGDGFDWGDAGIGALGAFGLALLLLGGLQVATRGRRGHATA